MAGPRTLGIAAAVALLVTACGGGFSLEPVQTGGRSGSALAGAPVSQVSVVIEPGIDGDKRAILEKHDVAAAMRAALEESFARADAYQPAAQGLTVDVEIVRFRLGRYDAAQMGTVTTVTDAQGRLVRRFETQSVSNAMTNRTDRLRRIAQENVAQVANGV